MKARMSIKIALFAVLSAIVCSLANIFLGLIEIAYVVEALFFVAYISMVIWLCKYVNKIKLVGPNAVVSFFTFSLALYLGIYSSLFADSTIAPYVSLVFYVMALVCLGSVLILLGRWIFGKNTKAETKNKLEEASQAGWTCSCGATNTGNFCANCGAVKPDSTTVVDVKQ